MDKPEFDLKKAIENIYLSIPIDLSLTSRRRKFILSRDFKSEKVHQLFQRAKFKLNCILYWSSIIKQIRDYGTGSSLFDGAGNYKENLSEIMDKKRLSPRNDEKYHENNLNPHFVKVEWKFVIFPYFFWFKLWNLVLCIALVYTCTVMPWVLAFEVDSNAAPWLYIDVIIDSIFFIDILITSNLAYRDKERNYVYSRKKIMKNYAKGMLMFDILAIIPFNYLTNSSHRVNTYFKILRLTRLIRLLKALKLNKILEGLTGGKEATYMAVNRLIICLILILLLIHFTSCIWNFTVRLDNYSPKTWLVRRHNQDKSNIELYFIGVYFAVTTIFTVGFGDYSAVTQLEQIICVLLQLIGIGFYSFVLGVTTSLLTSIDHKEIMLNTKMNMVSLLSKDLALAKSSSKQIVQELKWHFENLTLSDPERKSIISSIPKKVRSKVVSHMYRGRVSQIIFFRFKEKSFLNAYIPRLRYRTYKSRQVVFNEGDYPESMYFLMSGRVSFVFDKRNFVFKTMIAGSYFGEIGLIEKKSRDFGAITLCFCEVLEMSGEVLKEVSEQFPRVFEEIRTDSKMKNLRNVRDQGDIVDLVDIVDIRGLQSYEQLAGRKSLFKKESQVIYPCDWFDYKRNMELQNKVMLHELVVRSK